MGAIDLVVQVESPRSVSRGLQRIGRAGHQVGEPQPRPHLPQVPRRPGRVRRRRRPHARGRGRVDARAAQPARRAGPADRGHVRGRGVGGRRPRGAGAARLPVPRAAARPARGRARHAGRPLPVRRVRRAAAAHRLGPRRQRPARAARTRGRWPWPTPARSPTAASTACSWPTAPAASASSTRRWSTRPASARRSCSAPRRWRIERITRDRVLVSPAPGQPGQIPFWRGEGVGPAGRARPRGRRVRARDLGRCPRRGPWSGCATGHDLDELRRPRTCCATCAEQRAATGVLPTDRTIVVERFRDEIGDWRLCILQPVRRPGARARGRWRWARGCATSTASRRRRCGRTTASSCTCPTPTTRRRATSWRSTPTRSRTWSCASSATPRSTPRASARTPPARC